ncbi:uncharacterized protein PRCAT00000139001 [Priceomyces carsonii]|uniref:uncharacterized protein n=1 Tax=Priceomyces carsonii TaxID=28549 RepID=UPI002EDB0648|nr:unnamed protein product [Priceomyces carsonii]
MSDSSLRRSSGEGNYEGEVERSEHSDTASFHSSLNTKTTLHIPPIPPPEDITLQREVLFVACVCLSQLLTQAGVAQTMNPGVAIGKQFGVENNEGEVSWFSAAFSFTVGTFILVSGRFGDMYGYKLMYIIGFLWYGLLTIITGFTAFSSSSIPFNVMRALQGIGPAILMPNSQALIGHYYPDGKKKSICMCLFGAVAPGGCILGAIFSGLFTQLVWWPWAYWVAGIIYMVIALIGYSAIPKNILNSKTSGHDFLGTIFGISGLALFNFAWNQGPNVGWDKPYVYILLIIGILILVAFVFIERRAKYPLVPPKVMQGDTGFILGCIAAGWSSFGIWLYYTFRWSQLIDGDNYILSGVKLLPCLVFGFVAAFLAAFLLSRIPLSLVMFIAMCFFLAGLVIMGTRPVGQIYWAQKFVSLVITPFGMDCSFPTACILISMAVPKSQQGIAGSLVSTFVNYSILIGLGIAGTVEYYRTKGKHSNFDTEVLGMRNAFYMGMGLAGSGVLLSSLFMFKQLNKQRKNNLRAQETDNREEKA